MPVRARGEIVQIGCDGHLPDMKTTKEVRAIKGIFGTKRCWTKFCHFMPMARYKKIEISRCRECGKGENKKEEEVLVCSLCDCKMVKFVCF